MSIDMGQFHQAFFEESFEGLDAMESGLLNLDLGDADVEEINTIFRAAHSIKGGSGTFGFKDIANFTHVMETLLDEMRDGRRQVTQEAVDVLLRSVDCLREMLTATSEGGAVDQDRVSRQQAELDELLQDQATGAAPPATDLALDAEGSGEPSGWHIVFAPRRHLMRSGNDPVRLFRELSQLGELTVQVDTAQLPAFSELEPEDCYLSWDIRVSGNAPREAIDDIFAWVEDDSDLAIMPLQASNPSASAVAESPLELVAPIVERRTEGSDRRAGEDRRSPLDRRSGDRRKEATGSSASNTGSIRVSIDKVDGLINMVGELVITQSMLGMLGEEFEMSKLERLRDGLTQLERHTRELQESVMQIRMLPISFTFSRFPRMVHDTSTKLGKKIELKMSGENTEVDKTVIEKIGDPLVHLVRNSLDHGIEMPADRVAAGKPETGTIQLNAHHKGGSIIIEISDDGKGLPAEKLLEKARERGLVAEDANLTTQQIYELIFLPGFSTAEEISDVSGRGVGMDVVRKNVQSLGGNIDISSEEGVGTTFTIRLPLTLAILDGQSVAVGTENYIVPLVSIVESIQAKPEMINLVAGKGEVFKLRDEHLPIARLYEVFGVESAQAKKLEDGLLVVVEGDGRKCGLFVDDLLGQQQVVIKSLEANYRRVEGVSGATILGDGSVALILDIPGLLRLASQRGAVLERMAS